MTYKITAQQKKSNIVKQERAKWYKNLENAGVQFPLDAKLEARKAKTSERDNAHLAKMELKASIAPVKHTNNTQVFRLSKGIGFYSGPIDKFNPEFKFLRTLAQRFALLSKKNSCSVVVAQQSDSTMAFVLSKEVPCTQMNKPKSTTSNKGFIEMISMINTKIKTQNKDLLTKALNKAAYLNAKHDSKVQLDEETRQTAVKGPSAGLTDLALMIARKVVRQNGNPKEIADKETKAAESVQTQSIVNPISNSFATVKHKDKNEDFRIAEKETKAAKSVQAQSIVVSKTIANMVTVNHKDKNKDFKGSEVKTLKVESTKNQTPNSKKKRKLYAVQKHAAQAKEQHRIAKNAQCGKKIVAELIPATQAQDESLVIEDMPIVDDVVLSSQSTVQSVDTVTVSSPVSLLLVNCLSETLFDDSTANTYQVDHFIDVVPLKTSVVENHADNQMDTKTYMEGQMLQLHEHNVVAPVEFEQYLVKDNLQLEIENTQEHILTGKNQNVEIQAPKMAETDQAEKTLDSIIDQNFEVQSDGFEKMQLQLTNQNLVVEIQEPKMAVLDDIKKKQIKTVETGKATVHTSLKPKTKTFSGAWGDIFRELGQEDKPVHENTGSSRRRVKVEKYPELGYMYEAAGFKGY